MLSEALMISKISYSPYIKDLVFQRFADDNAAVLHVQGGSTSCAHFRARPVGFAFHRWASHNGQSGIHGFLVEQEVAQFVAGGHIPLPIRNGVVLMHKMPRVLLVAPSDGGIMVQVVVRHENVGVAPAVVGVGGTCQAVDIVGFAPRQLGFIQRNHQTV